MTKTSGSKPKTTRTIASLDDTRALAREIALEHSGARSKGSKRLLILLDGPMGAGKTQFTKFLVQEFGSDETVSPSFAIHNRYSTPIGSIDHFDLYRLEREDDLESTGFWDIFASREAVVIVEWASKLAEMGLSSGLPRAWPTLSLAFEVVADDARRVVIEGSIQS